MSVKIVTTERMKMDRKQKNEEREERERMKMKKGWKRWKKRWKEGNCKEEALPFNLVCVPVQTHINHVKKDYDSFLLLFQRMRDKGIGRK